MISTPAPRRELERYDPVGVDRREALRCALERLCFTCGRPQGYPLVFVGPVTDRSPEQFPYPPMHEACARSVLRRWGTAPDAASGWILVATGSYTVERPRRREPGQRVSFAPGELLWTRVTGPDPAG